MNRPWWYEASWFIAGASLAVGLYASLIISLSTL